MVRARSKSKPIKRFTHAARAARRKEMAMAVKSGKSNGQVARKFKVSIRTVRDAVAEFLK